MERKLSREYPHLIFDKKQWGNLNSDVWFYLGQCESLINSIKYTPLQPKYYEELMNVSLIKGAQSTTAIEGNTLTIEEIAQVRGGEKLPPSKEYQETEIVNVLEAFYTLFSEVFVDDKDSLISRELLLRFHKMVGKNLGEHLEATPGQFREREVIVGKYRCPDHRDVAPLIEKLCEWLREEFKFEGGKQSFSTILIQALVTHVYIEWIHPFSDGNGRTGRLTEFYILLRGGFPNIVIHLLSNHYNLTRPEYYRQLDKSSETGDLSNFILYAVRGFRDGLKQILHSIRECQTEYAWKNYIYDQFSEIPIGQKDVFKRRRALALNFPLHKEADLSEIPKLNMELAYMYSGISEKTLTRDLDELCKLDILEKNESKFKAKISLLNGKMPLHRNMTLLQ